MVREVSRTTWSGTVSASMPWRTTSRRSRRSRPLGRTSSLFDLMLPPGRRLRSLPPPPLGMLGAFSVPGLRALVLTVSAKGQPAIGPEPRSAGRADGRRREARRMRKLRWIVLTGALVTLAPVVPANAASPQARCPGQERPRWRRSSVPTSARRSASSRTRTVRTARRSSETFRRSTRL